MKLIMEGIYDLFTDDNFLYFQITDARGKNNKFVRHNQLGSEVIKKEEYFKARYGINYEKIMHYFKDRPAARAIHKDGSVFVCFYQESIIYKFDKYGDLIRKYNEMKSIDTLYDIAIQDNSIWCAYPTSHTVKRFSLVDGEEELTVSEGSMADERGTIFCYPESILIKNNTMFVADMGNKRICKVDLTTFEVDTHIDLPEPIFGSERLGVMEFAILNSGLYLL